MGTSSYSNCFRIAVKCWPINEKCPSPAKKLVLQLGSSRAILSADLRLTFLSLLPCQSTTLVRISDNENPHGCLYVAASFKNPRAFCLKFSIKNNSNFGEDRNRTS